MDRERVFVGSFNFDQRSAWLNTEMGLLSTSTELAGRLSSWFDEEVPSVAYHVVLQDDDSLCWIERTAEGQVRHKTEPGSGFIKRGWIALLSALPIEWLF